MMDAGALALVVRAGAGYNTIDVAAASARGIYVSNCPGRNAVAVAELTLGSHPRARSPHSRQRRRRCAPGQWDKKAFSKAAGLKGKTLGLLGFGAIGREVAQRAQACGLHLTIWSRSLEAGTDPAALGLQSRPDSHVTVVGAPGDVAAGCDILSIHVALGPETRGLVDARAAGTAQAGRLRGEHRARRK